MVLVSLRGLHLVMVLSLSGTLVFRNLVAPSALVAAPDRAVPLTRDLHRLARGSGGLALGLGAGWLLAEAAAIAGVSGIAATLQILPAVVFETRFGSFLLWRLAMLLLSLVLIGRADRAAAAVALVATGMQGWFGHAGAAEGAEGVDLLVSEALHLLAAGVWLGSLLPLWLCLRVLPAPAAAIASRRFSPIGMTAVLVLAGTGLLQGLMLIGSTPGLVGTPYGQAALVKLVLFGLMLGLALHNRLALTDRLASHPGTAQARFKRSVLLEAALGLLVVGAAAALGSLTPALHEQPVWPFPWRPSLEVMADEDLRREVVVALVLLGLGVAAVTASLILQRGRIVGLLFFVVVAVTRGPSLGLLLVEAYPTSFYISPTGFAASGIMEGRVLYASYCSRCHGTEGRGDGPDAGTLRVRPVDLTASHLMEHADGELFWWLANGIDDPGYGKLMPGFERQMTDAQRWALIDFIRARNAGVAWREHGDWPVPVPAPALPIRCHGVPATEMRDLRGRVVQVIADVPGTPEPPAVETPSGVSLVRLHLSTDRPGDCVAATPDAWGAYAVLSGQPPERLAGSVFLVDQGGWLRAGRVPGDKGPGWDDPARLIADIERICANPLSVQSGVGHEHHEP
jgi:putative copper export protein/mono/diheme cytochrome c family protein